MSMKQTLHEINIISMILFEDNEVLLKYDITVLGATDEDFPFSFFLTNKINKTSSKNKNKSPIDELL